MFELSHNVAIKVVDGIFLAYLAINTVGLYYQAESIKNKEVVFMFACIVVAFFITR